MFTKEQINKLKELDVIQHFETIRNSNFKRGTFKSTDSQVADLLENATGKKVSRNFSCKMCVYNLYLEAGTLYFESVKYLKQENLKKARETKKQNKINSQNGNK